MTETDDLGGRSSAGALHDVLDAIRSSPVQTLSQAWSKVLDAPWGSLEFAQRHAEVVCLWNDAFNQINALANAQTRKRMLAYASSWWSALIAPGVQWEAGNSSPANAITQSDLDQLASMSDLVSAQLRGTATAPIGTDLADLRAQCEEWLILLGNSEEITDEPFRRTLLALVDHLVWLIDHAHLFGIARVIQQGDQLTGALIRATDLPESRIRDRIRFKRLLAGLLAALAAVAGMVRNTETIIDAAQHSIPAIENVVQEIVGSHSADTNNKGTEHK